MTRAQAETPVFELKGRMMTLTVLRILTPSVEVLARELDKRIQQAPDFFRHLPVILDVEAVADSDLYLDLAGLAGLLQAREFVPVGVRGGGGHWVEAASAAGLAVFPVDRESSAGRRPDAAGNGAAGSAGVDNAAAGSPAGSAETAVATPATAPTRPEPISDSRPDSRPAEDADATAAAGNAALPAEESATPREGSLVITQPVRSGQQIYARGGDLVILNSVSPGAEVIADGHVHIYGTLNGRALAGVRGDTKARIFCQSFRAELVSVAGTYSINEQFEKNILGRPVQISLRNDTLQIDTL